MKLFTSYDWRNFIISGENIHSFQPLTIITKHSILNVAAALDPPLIHSVSYGVTSRKKN